MKLKDGSRSLGFPSPDGAIEFQMLRELKEENFESRRFPSPDGAIEFQIGDIRTLIIGGEPCFRPLTGL